MVSVFPVFVCTNQRSFRGCPLMQLPSFSFCLYIRIPNRGSLVSRLISHCCRSCFPFSQAHTTLSFFGFYRLSRFSLRSNIRRTRAIRSDDMDCQNQLPLFRRLWHGIPSQLQPTGASQRFEIHESIGQRKRHSENCRLQFGTCPRTQRLGIRGFVRASDNESRLSELDGSRTLEGRSGSLERVRCLQLRHGHV